MVKIKNLWIWIIWVLAAVVLVVVSFLWLRYFRAPVSNFPPAQGIVPIEVTPPPDMFVTPTLTATPTQDVVLTPTPTINRPGEYACDPIGICNHYINTNGIGCPKNFSEPTCNNECGNEKVRCEK